MLHLPRRLIRLLWPLLLLTSALRADSSLAQVRRAQSLLGQDIWSRIIRIENEGPASVYPKNLHALVFELVGLLWFYTPANGTQSFSLHFGRLAEEKANFAPLLRDIEPGFVRWRVVAPERCPTVDSSLVLANGCFIESVAELRRRLAQGERVEQPRLLSYYVAGRAGLSGHTVLAYGHEGHTEIFDPARPGERFDFSAEMASTADALTLAQLLDGPEVEKARYVAVELSPFARSGLVSKAATGSKSGTSRLMD